MESAVPTSDIATLQAILDGAVDAIVSIDEHGELLNYNAAAAQLFQYAEPEVRAGGIGMLMPSDIATRHPDFIRRYLDEGERHIIGVGRELTCQRKDGSRFQAYLSLSESNSGDKRVFTAIIHDLTERNRLRARVSAIGDILEESINALYVLERQSLRVNYANRAASTSYGADEVVGPGLCLADLVTANSYARLERAMQLIDEGHHQSFNLKVDCRRACGEIYPAQLHLSTTTFDDNAVFVASVIDVTSQRKAEQALEDERLEHAAVLNYAPIGIVTMDSRGLILNVNESACDMLGYDEEAFIGRHGTRFVHTDEQLSLRSGFDSLIAGDTQYLSSVHKVRHKQGHYVPVRTFNAAVVLHKRKRPILICMFEDLSEQHAIEEEIKTQRERLAHVAQLTQMGEMAAGLAHELNQPLSAIVTYAGVGERLLGKPDKDDDELRAICSRISQQAERAGSVIRKIRQLTRRHESSRSKCSLNSLVTDLLPLVEIDVRHSGIELHLALGENAAVMADPVQIEQVILNFLRNAIDEARKLPADRQSVTVRTSRASNGIRLEVVDNGPGVDAALRDTLFDPFVSSKAKGMGMGLSISKSIIDAHSGQIGFDQPDDGGSVFWFVLPEYRQGAENDGDE
ncbi:MAG: PAS domain S-box protein [Pseudomonadota bacterium]